MVSHLTTRWRPRTSTVDPKSASLKTLFSRAAKLCPYAPGALDRGTALEPRAVPHPVRRKPDAPVQLPERRHVDDGRGVGDFHRMAQLVAERGDLVVIVQGTRHADVQVAPAPAASHELQAAEQPRRH